MMQEAKKTPRILTVLSVIYVAGALWLLLTVCGFCYPQVGESVRQALAGLEDSALQEAFGTLTEGLEAGLPVRETVAASIEVLVGEIT